MTIKLATLQFVEVTDGGSMPPPWFPTHIVIYAKDEPKRRYWARELRTESEDQRKVT